MPLRPGERFGRYELAELLGRGGMGEVYSAYDSILHRKVALKVLTAPAGHAGTDPPASGGAGRILREARAAAGITHPNAVSIYDVGEVEGVPFLAMELVAGRTLRSFIGDTAVPLGSRIRWIADVARALGAAHQLGLVHRDIKPENVMVRDDGLVKVLDFGIARRAVGTREEGVPPNLEDIAALGKLAVSNGTLTAQGMIVGTPMYMAPEQMRGDAVDGRTDQFAWGVLAYEVLTGRIPWTGEGVAMLSQILTKEAAPLTDASREIPGPVDAVVRKALSKSPAGRFGTMEIVADELEPFATTAGTTGRRERVSIPVRDLELAATEQIAISADDVRMQSGAQALTQARTGGGARWRGRSGIAMGALAVAAAFAWGWGVDALSRKPVARLAVVDAGDVPSQMSSNAEATAAYRAGLQGLRDGSISAATKQLRRAVNLDPLFAAAQLRLALTNALDISAPTMTTSADLQGARTSQASLGTHDKTLLDAFDLVARVPPDFKASERLLEAAVQKYPGDADFPFQLSLVLDYAEQPAEAVKVLDTSISRDPTFAFAWRMKAQLLIEFDDAAGATTAFEQCLKISPGATTCLGDLAGIQAHQGKCEELVRTSRRLVSLVPDAYEPYVWLAQGLIGIDESTDAVRVSLQQVLDRLPATSRALSRVSFDAALAMMAGDFLKAERAYQEYDRLAASRTEESEKFEIAYARVLIDLEIGHAAEARQLADAFLRKRAGLSPSGYDHSLTMDAAELAGGEMTRAAFADAREKWLARNPEVAGSYRWINAYALATATPEDAVAALAAEPDTRPLVGLVYRSPSFAEPIGRTYSLAGRLDESVDYLRTASASCDLLSGKEVMFSTWATLELGRTLEQRGDVPGACAAYHRVLVRWGAASPPSKTAAKALERKRALGCAP